MKNKKFLSGALAAALALSLTTPALAAGSGWTDGADPERVYDHFENVGKDEWEAQSDTTINIFETTAKVNQLSFEVPLYVTLAVVNGERDVIAPDMYAIYNTSKDENGDPSTTFKIGVTGMTFSKLGNGYNTVNYIAKEVNAQGQETNTAALDAVLTNNSEIMLSIGNVKMPALDAVGSTPIDFKDANSFVNAGGLKLYDSDTGKCEPIAAGAYLSLPIVGMVKVANDRQNSKAAAQFKVSYVVSALDDQDMPIGAVYAGNSSVNAGLGTWTGRNTWDPDTRP